MNGFVWMRTNVIQKEAVDSLFIEKTQVEATHIHMAVSHPHTGHSVLLQVIYDDVLIQVCSRLQTLVSRSVDFLLQILGLKV